jgi:glycosyltransferase involved in cell wall biosynthesis
MRILYVLPFVPWPVKVRSFNLIPRLAAKHKIDLVCVVRSGEDQRWLEAIRPLCSSVRTGSFSAADSFLNCLKALPTAKPLRIAYARSESMRTAVENALRENSPDVIYVERWRALQYVPPDSGVPVVCDPTDSMALYNKRLMASGNWWERILGLEEYLKFRSYEGALARRAKVAVFCSKVDLEFVRKIAPEAQLTHIVNGVDCRLFHFKSEMEEEPNTIYFSGNFGYSPNRHALRYFNAKVLPLVRKSVSTARFVVVGNGASEFARREGLAGKGLVVKNFVEEIRPHLAAATVAVAPMTIGSGVSNKLLEAFAVGTPVVSSSIAVGDLPVRDRKHLFIADTPEIFADRVVQLLLDRELRRSMAQNAVEFVKTQYDWRTVTDSMERILQEVSVRAAMNAETPVEC